MRRGRRWSAVGRATALATGVGVLLGAGAPHATAGDPFPVAEPLPDRNPAVHDAWDGEWQVSPEDPRDPARLLNPYLVPVDAYDADVHQLTAIVADSTVNLWDSRWLDATIVTSQGTPVLPLVTDGPLWDYSVNGSVLTQADPLFPINRVIFLDETPDRLIVAQGVNNASPTWHNGWNGYDERDFDAVVADAGAGVGCIVIVTPGYKTGPGDPNVAGGPASAAERTELDQAAAWMRAKARTDPRFVLADWHALSISRPEWWFNDVHADEDGSDQYEALITRAARQCPDPVQWAPTQAVSDKLVAAAYEDFLRRTVSPADLVWWRGNLAATGYGSTPLFGQLTKDDGFSDEVVGGLYEQLLGRPADRATEISYWRAGVEARTTTVAELAQNVIASREFSTLAGSGSAAFVDRVYETVLDRLPARADRDYWVGQLTGGVTKGAVGGAIFQSAESRDRRAAALAQRYLKRRLNVLEKSWWRAVLGASDGDDVAMAIAMAKLPEYRDAAQSR